MVASKYTICFSETVKGLIVRVILHSQSHGFEQASRDALYKIFAYRDQYGESPYVFHTGNPVLLIDGYFIVQGSRTIETRKTDYGFCDASNRWEQDAAKSQGIEIPVIDSLPQIRIS